MTQKKLFLLACASLAASGAYADRILHIPMDLQGRDAISETVSGSSIPLFSKTYPENIAGAAGNALRLDGFSAYAQAT